MRPRPSFSSEISTYLYSKVSILTYNLLYRFAIRQNAAAGGSARRRRVSVYMQIPGAEICLGGMKERAAGESWEKIT